MLVLMKTRTHDFFNAKDINTNAVHSVHIERTCLLARNSATLPERDAQLSLHKLYECAD